MPEPQERSSPKEEAEENHRQGVVEPDKCRRHSIADSRVDQVNHDVAAIKEHRRNAMEYEQWALSSS